MDVVMRFCGPLDLRDEDVIERWDFYCESFSLMQHQLDRRGIECLPVKCANVHKQEINWSEYLHAQKHLTEYMHIFIV